MNYWNKEFITNRYTNQTNFNAVVGQFYSQYNQDRTLENCIFKGYKNGVFMDVGAHDGVDLNNTLFFEKTHNWTGFNIEPLDDVYRKLLTNRKNSKNIKCAVSDVNGTSEFMANTGYTEMLSGLKNEYNNRHLERIKGENIREGGRSNVVMVETKTIETICEEDNIKHINYLSIDVEGGEFRVLKSINFDKVFIDVIGFENNYPDEQHIPVNYLKDKGYIQLPHHTADIFMIHKNSIFLHNIFK